mmetsp:Transcript_26334/g.86506  ORF Transcript_26334/g.86506 Transcript_26334/m.86506 type:complete len:207 (+) Transcript_26334:836-1456(+)
MHMPSYPIALIPNFNPHRFSSSLSCAVAIYPRSWFGGFFLQLPYHNYPQQSPASNQLLPFNHRSPLLSSPLLSSLLPFSSALLLPDSLRLSGVGLVLAAGEFLLVFVRHLRLFSAPLPSFPVTLRRLAEARRAELAPLAAVALLHAAQPADHPIRPRAWRTTIAALLVANVARIRFPTAGEPQPSGGSPVVLACPPIRQRLPGDQL